MQPNNSDPEKALQQATRRRQRLLYSLNDLQQALSASALLHELDEGEKYSKDGHFGGRGGRMIVAAPR
jgi:hypothetical protein